MDILELQEKFLNRERKIGYDSELVQLFGIKFGFDIEGLANQSKMRFVDIALLITRNEDQAKLVESGYRLYEYVKPR